MNNKHRKIVRLDIHHTVNELRQEKMFLKERNEYLSKKEAGVERIIEMMTHELRTPLVPINAYTDMLLDGQLGKLNKKQLEKLKVISSNTKSMYQLISNLLDAEKFEIGEITLNKRQHYLNEIILDTISSIKDRKSELDEMLYYSPNTETLDIMSTIPVFCDSKRISQVLTHLIENSLNAVLEDRGRIVINVEDGEENTFKVMVKDNGIGISSDQISKIFSKFYQTDMSHTREKGGAGLGLYLCRKIIESHGGKIWATSTIGKGTLMTFVLPKA